MVIPAAGATVDLTMQNISLYRRIIGVYEGNTLEIKNGEILVNGSKATTYTFKQNYYWAQGDNRHNSEDSRFWGFVPEDHIVGKPLFIWMSVGNSGIRWNRIFTSANKP
jgi:signal peptidase I